MKLRSIILFVSLSIALAACSLAEDITPPASYVSPTSLATVILPTSVPPTQTPVPSSTATFTATAESVTATVETTSATATDGTPAATTEVTLEATDQSTPAAEVSPTPQVDLVDIGGTVTISTGGTLPSTTTATLLVYSMTLGQVTNTLLAPVRSDGKYTFTAVPADTSTVFLVTVDYSGVTYDSSPVQFDGSLFTFDVPVTVYETTADLNTLSITQAHIQMDFSTAGTLQVMALYVISNPGETAVTVTSDGSSVPFIIIPDGATNVQYQLAQSSSPLLTATNGFALLPGSSMQYGIITSFDLPYTKSLVFSQPFNLPVASATIIVPEGVKIKSDQLTDAGTQVSSTTPPVTYHLYQANSLATGSTLTLTISGMPGDKPGFVLDQRTWTMIGIGVVGLILIGLGIFLFLRDRKLKKLEEEEENEGEVAGEADSLGNDRESIMDAIIALDDQYKAGDILKEAYEKRRDELKERLKNLA